MQEIFINIRHLWSRNDFFLEEKTCSPLDQIKYENCTIMRNDPKDKIFYEPVGRNFVIKFPPKIILWLTQKLLSTQLIKIGQFLNLKLGNFSLEFDDSTFSIL